MARSYGSIAAAGILGGIIGAGKATADNAEFDMKNEAERIKEERLSKLRMGEYRQKAEMDIEMAPRKAVAEAEGKAQGEEITRPGIIETRRQTTEVDTEAQGERERQKKDIEGEYADQDADREGKKAGARAKAEEPYKAADDRRRGDEQIRVARVAAEEARKNNWRIDAEGFYTDGDGQRIRRTERVEGRPVEVFVKAPENKVSGKDWKMQEELDSINRRIEQTEKRASTAMTDDEKAASEAAINRLLDEKDKLLGRTKPRAPSSSSSSSNRPPLSSFGK